MTLLVSIRDAVWGLDAGIVPAEIRRKGLPNASSNPAASSSVGFVSGLLFVRALSQGLSRLTGLLRCRLPFYKQVTAPWGLLFPTDILL